MDTTLLPEQNKKSNMKREKFNTEKLDTAAFSQMKEAGPWLVE